MKSTWLHLTILVIIFTIVRGNIEDDEYHYEDFPEEYQQFLDAQQDLSDIKNKPNCRNKNNPNKATNMTELNRQSQPGPLMMWIQSILGLKPPTTTTQAPPTEAPSDCPECTRCGKTHNGTKIVGKLIKSRDGNLSIHTLLKALTNVYDSKRIVGGSETGINQYPWMAMLEYSKRFYCGASLINDRYVVACHCVHGFNVKRITVRLLEHDRSNPDETKTQTYNVSKIIKHPRYSQTNFDNDIALLKLERPVSFEGILNPICLPTPGEWYTGYDGVVAGWGTLSEGGDVSQTLQHVSVPIISNSACKKTKYNERRITDNMMCAGYKEGQKDSCQGDSGGPLMVCDDMSGLCRLVGVVSWGEGCAQEGYPGVYARVNRYGSWLRENTADACKCSPS